MTEKNKWINFLVRPNMPVKGRYRKILYTHNLFLHYSFPLNICNSSLIFGVLGGNKPRNSKIIEYIYYKIFLRHKPKIDLCCKLFLGEAKQFDSEIMHKLLLRKCLFSVKVIKQTKMKFLFGHKNWQKVSQNIMWSHLNLEIITAKNENWKLALCQFTVRKHTSLYISK